MKKSNGWTVKKKPLSETEKACRSRQALFKKHGGLCAGCQSVEGAQDFLLRYISAS